MENSNETKTWKEVQITPDIPLGAAIQFLNILNERLSNLEDIITVQGPDEKPITVTELYRLQVLAAMNSEKVENTEE